MQGIKVIYQQKLSILYVLFLKKKIFLIKTNILMIIGC